MKNHLVVTTTAILLGFLHIAHAAVIADLSSDWSNTINPNTSNPNGTWEYREGANDLPSVSNWGSFTTAWAPSNNNGNFLPAEFQVTSQDISIFGTDPNNGGASNVVAGDIVMHTWDQYNGQGEGLGNYLFTSHVAGSVTISGMVWDASLLYGSARPQAWVLFFNNNEIASGSLDGSVSRSEAETFDLSEALGIGDTIELEIVNTDGIGYYVGSDLTISNNITNTPEPGSIALLISSLLGIGFAKGHRYTKK